MSTDKPLVAIYKPYFVYFGGVLACRALTRSGAIKLARQFKDAKILYVPKIHEVWSNS